MRHVRVRLVSLSLFAPRGICCAFGFSRCGFAALALVAPLMALYGVFGVTPYSILFLHVRAVWGRCRACGGLLWRVYVW